MKIKIILIAISLFGWGGCAVNQYTGPNGVTLTQYFLFQKASAGKVVVSDKGFSLSGGNLETQSDAIEAVARGVAAGVVKGATHP